MPATIRITAALAERHEALWLKLAALLAQGRDTAIKKPDALVPDEVRIMAEGLLHDVGLFAPKGRRDRLPVAAAHWGALAAQLGQGQAVLDAYEDQHTGWADEKQYRVWLIKGAPVPVRRHRPARQFPPIGPDSIIELRRKLADRFERAYLGHFQRGYAAGRDAAFRTYGSTWPVPDATTAPDYPAIPLRDTM